MPGDPSAPSGAATPDLDALAPCLLATVRSVADELRPQAGLATALGLDHSLERDFGLDSLARVELITRIGHELGLSVGEAALTEAETPRDLLRFITVSGDAAVLGPGAEAPPGPQPHEAEEPPLASAAQSYPPDSVQTLVEVFDWHLRQHPQRVLITLYGDGDAQSELSYADLHRDALALAAGLQALGLAKGDSVAIMLPTGREFFAAFFGVLLAGAVPVPLYPPARPSQLEDHLQTHCRHPAQCARPGAHHRRACQAAGPPAAGAGRGLARRSPR